MLGGIQSELGRLASHWPARLEAADVVDPARLQPVVGEGSARLCQQPAQLGLEAVLPELARECPPLVRLWLAADRLVGPKCTPTIAGTQSW